MSWEPPKSVMDPGQGNRWKLLRSNAQLQELAKRAEEASGGKVCFAYSAQPAPSGKTYYVFDELGEDAVMTGVQRMTAGQATEYLMGVVIRYTEAPGGGDGSAPGAST